MQFSLAVLPMDRWLVHRAPPSCWRAAVSLAPGRTLWWGEWTPGSFPSQWRQCQSSLDRPDYRWTHKYLLNINTKHNKQTNLCEAWHIQATVDSRGGYPLKLNRSRVDNAFLFQTFKDRCKPSEVLENGDTVAKWWLHTKACVTSVTGQPGGNFISLKLLIGAGISSPSTRMWNFFLTRSCLAPGMFRM